MTILGTKHKKKSAIITAVLLLLFLLISFNFGLSYLDPPEEYGLAIQFGTAQAGTGKNTPVAPAKISETKKQPIVSEKVVSSSSSKAISLKKPALKEPSVKEPPKPSKATQDALQSLLKGAENKQEKSNGVLEGSGIQGSKNGEKSASSYYGNSGDAGDKNYNLSGRTALSKPIQQPNCEEEGIVVVRIEVDTAGRVVLAIPGIKGSTNTAPCLLKPAKEAALKTRWNPDKKAPVKQQGTIVYRFSLSE